MAPRHFYRTGTVSMNSCKHKNRSHLLRCQKNSIKGHFKKKKLNKFLFTELSVNALIFSYPFTKIHIIPNLNKPIVCINTFHISVILNSSIK